MKRTLSLLLLLLFLSLTEPVVGTADTNQPLVAVSIKPLHSLISSLMLDIAEPALIVAAAGSPHGYNLRPSEARSLQQARLIIWVGPALESFMAKSLHNIDPKNSILTLLTDLPELTILPARKGGEWHEQHNHDDSRPHADQADPHIWLSPDNAAGIAIAITPKLIGLDPANKSHYTINLEALLTRLTALDRDLTRRLARLQKRNYVVFHDAYQYFEKHFGLTPVGALAVDPDRRPGVRRLIELKRVIRELAVECVFTEPQFEPRLAAVLTEGTMTRTGILDPLGSDLAPGSDLYFILMERMAASIESCLPEQQ